VKAHFNVTYKGFNDEPATKIIKDFLNKKDPSILKKARLLKDSSGFAFQTGTRDCQYSVNLPKNTILKPKSFKKDIYKIELTVS
jgi:hypothetical protein